MRWPCLVSLALGCTSAATTPTPTTPPAATAPTTAAPTTAAPTTAAPPRAPWLPTITTCPLAGIDWCTHDYGDELDGVSIVGGWYELHLYDCEGTPFEGEHSTTSARLVGATTGDLDGDGADEVVVTLARDEWACGQRQARRNTTVAVFATAGAAPTALGSAWIDVAPATPPTVTAGVVRITGADGCTQDLAVDGGKLTARTRTCP